MSFSQSDKTPAGLSPGGEIRTKVVTRRTHSDDPVKDAMLAVKTTISRPHAMATVHTEVMARKDEDILMLNDVGIDAICEAVYAGAPLPEIADQLKVTPRNLLTWIRLDPSRESEYNQSRKDYAAVLQDEALRVTAGVAKTSLGATFQANRSRTLLAVADKINPPDKTQGNSAIKLVLGFGGVGQDNDTPKVIDAEVTKEDDDGQQVATRFDIELGF